MVFGHQFELADIHTHKPELHTEFDMTLGRSLPVSGVRKFARSKEKID
jgi:hypothetical protein